jgi:hypothetical protein
MGIEESATTTIFHAEKLVIIPYKKKYWNVPIPAALLCANTKKS